MLSKAKERGKERFFDLKTQLIKLKKLSIIFGVLAVALLIVALAAFMLFQRGYADGLPTKDSPKTDIKQYLCPHNWSDRSGRCSICGLQCTHPAYNDFFNCTVCGYHHEHTFDENGICTECGRKCEHPRWSKGKCVYCGYECPHENFIDNKCTLCGLVCTHPSYENGVCEICGTHCKHLEWENGKCKECKMECDHRNHSQTTGICNVCGTVVKHDFTKGVCVCGLTPPFVYGDLPASILNECFNQGVVRTYQYSTKKYADGNTPITKNFDIYLPYGYDRNNKYDVILMMHGDGGKYNDWTTNSLTIGSLMTVPKNIYDNVIDQGLCKPFILVSVPTLYQTENGETDSGYKQMAPEIRNDLLPFIVKNFGTYAEDSSLAAISAAREHFAIGGVDNGATYAYYCGMKENFDLFANFVCFSGCATPEEYVKNIEKGNNAKLPVKTYVNGAGSNDPARFRCLKGFDVITGSSDKFQESINSYYVEVNGGHNWASWATLTYDALLVLFQDSVFQ